jgi:hypothetical protein
MEDALQDTVLRSGWDNVVVALPFVLMLAVGLFRLDSMMAAPKTVNRRANRIVGTDENGEPIVCDPDGRLSK